MSASEILTLWTLGLAAAVVLALAGYLIAIAWYLYRTGGSSRSHLARLAGGLQAIAGNAAPLEDRLTTVAGALSALQAELSAVADELDRTAAAVRR